MENKKEARNEGNITTRYDNEKQRKMNEKESKGKKRKAKETNTMKGRGRETKMKGTMKGKEKKRKVGKGRDRQQGKENKNHHSEFIWDNCEL